MIPSFYQDNIKSLKTQIKFDEFTFIMNTGFLKEKETMQIISRKKGNSL